MSHTAREVDTNGWFEIKGNPLSRVGVFDYMGSMCDPTGELGLDQDKVYSVYRSEAELSNAATLKSFEMVPWIDEHTILGDGSEHLTPADEKGIKGMVGNEVYFEDGFLRGNIKLFSQDLGDSIDSGKSELSCGYRCDYALQSGRFGDADYELVQTNIRGNHLASVDAGRMGPEVAVLDENLIFTVDSEDFKPMAKKTDKVTLDDKSGLPEVITALTGIQGVLVTLTADMAEMKAKDEEKEEEAKAKAADEEKEEEAKAKAADEEKEEKSKGEDSKLRATVDSLATSVKTLTQDLKTQKAEGFKAFIAEAGKRDELYTQAARHIGSFAHDSMSVPEMAKYVCDKLDLKVAEGHEQTALDIYFANKQPSTAFASDFSDISDSSEATEQINDYFGGTH